MSVTIILDKIYNVSVPKPTSLRPGYDIEYTKAHCRIYTIEQFEKMLWMERLYDNLSIIRSYETPQQWADRVRGTVQTLIAEGYRKSFYHVFCLFGSFGQGVTKSCYSHSVGRELPISYHRPSVHKSQMAICFKCWKLVKITERRWGYEIKSEDLMKNHWDNSCFKAETGTIAKNTIPSAPNFEPTCISPTSYHSSGPSQRCSEPGVTSKVFMSSLYADQNNFLPTINHLNQSVLKLDDRTEITIV
ncbi:hypothetical protein RhiirC2_857795 [Rhizophagus irregularis]|uniref:Uncharacterized protein n=1 Tax=Rhizophagus irregularis TaxID=588596 RepID=A0A2N1M9W1_9GLOM|nr:hypothetical protein RhiirC2_857795 [Rhizophagus irregularis]